MRRNKTIEAFFTLVKAGLWETEARIASFGEVDFGKILRIASEQSIVGLVAAGVENVVDVKIPQQIVLQVIGQTLQIEQRNQAMNVFIAELIAEMKRADIYALLVKGQGIAQCYERPLWRASGDVDLFLSEENYEKAKALLSPVGIITETEEVDKKHFAMEIDCWSVELHGTLHGGLSSRVDKVIDTVQDSVFLGGNVRSWMNGNTQVFLPAADEDVIFVFSHIMQHFYKGGIGLRQICDWCRLLWTYREEIDGGLLEERLRSMDLMSEWKAFGAFAEEYLGMPVDAMPLYDGGAKWKSKASRICSFVMDVGNMGHNRDWSYMRRYPYLVRKFVSFWRRCVDSLRHALIFPLDSLRFFPRIVLNGVRSAARGE